MYEHPGSRGQQGPPPWPDPRYGVPPRGVSGLFPSAPMRPTFREQYPIRAGSVAAGLGGALGWLLVFGLLGRDLVGYAWATITAGVVAWVTALLLARYGDRGVATGIAIATALGLSIVTTAVAVRWAMSDDWPLW